MILAADCFAGTALRRFMLVLLAFVMPFQAMASAAFTAIGPAHVHEAPAQGMVLVDVRRVAYGTVERAHLDVPLLHLHHARQAQRHHHAPDDSSVVLADDSGSLNKLDADDGRSLCAALASIFAGVPGTHAWPAGGCAMQRAWSPLWAPSSGGLARLERPPRQA